MLILGYDPENQSSYNVENNKNEKTPHGYGALKTALINALITQRIEGNIIYREFDFRGNPLDNREVDIDQSILPVSTLRDYLNEKGFKAGFFFPEGNISEEYLDSQNQYYAPKLAAAVNAWKAITHDPNLLNGKTPKQAMQKWLRENAARYGLAKDDGSPNETGIEEICKVSNWQTGGGAARTPATPTQVNDNTPPLQKPQILKIFGVRHYFPDSIADEIPF
jgi:hypothetical protein